MARDPNAMHFAVILVAVSVWLLTAFIFYVLGRWHQSRSDRLWAEESRKRQEMYNRRE